MTAQKQTLNRISLVLSVIALVLAIVAMVSPARQAPGRTDDSYDRVVREVWEIMQPLYRDMDVAISVQEPKTLSDALEPLVRVSGALEGGS